MSRAAARIAIVALTCGTMGCGAAPIAWLRGGGGPETAATGRAPHGAESHDLAQLQALSAAEPAEPYWPFRLGELHAAAGAMPEAEAALLLALTRQPNYAPAIALLTRIHYDAGRHDEAITLLERRLNSATPPLTSAEESALGAALALHYEAAGKREMAERAAGSLSTDPSCTAAARASATFIGLRGDDYLGCAALARAAVEHDPESAANQNNYGITLLYAGDPEGARTAFRRALDLDSQLAGAHYNLAIVERSYFFDDAAARAHWAAYRKLGSEDPDGLAQAFADGAPDSAPGAPLPAAAAQPAFDEGAESVAARPKEKP
jgi:tetratricopeptide (TPR) repeat protein